MACCSAKTVVFRMVVCTRALRAAFHNGWESVSMPSIPLRPESLANLPSCHRLRTV